MIVVHQIYSLVHCVTCLGHVLTVARPILLLGQLCTAWFTVLLAVSHCVSLTSPHQTSKVSGPGAVRLQIIVCATCAVLFTMPRTFDAAVTVTWRTSEGKDVSSALADHPLYRFAYVDVLTLCALYVVPLVLLACVSVRLTLLLNRRRRQYWQQQQRVCDTAERLTLTSHPRHSSMVLGVEDGGSSMLHHSHTQQQSEMDRSTLRTQQNHAHNYLCSNQQQQPAEVDDRTLTDVVLMLSLCIFICYLPTALLTIWSVAVGDRRAMCGEAQFYARSFTQLIVVINSAIKMLLLLLFVPHFRDAIRRLCCCCAVRRQRQPSQGQGRSYNDHDALMTSSAGGIVGMRTESVAQPIAAAPSVRFGPYRCSDTSEMTLMSSVTSSGGPGHTPSYVDDVTFWE